MKYEKLLSEVIDYLDSIYKGSELTFDMYVREIRNRSNSENCFKETIKLLWKSFYFDTEEEYIYCKNELKEDYGINV